MNEYSSNIPMMLTTLREIADRPAESPLSLPGPFFTSPEYFELEKDSVLKNGWHCIGRADEIPMPGDYLAIDLLNEPLLVVRGDDHAIRILANVCRHRGMRLAEASGNTKRFVCPYHAWSYNRDGTLARAAHMTNEGFKAADCKLEEYKSKVWNGFIYVCISEDAEFPTQELDALSTAITPYEPENYRIVHTAEEIWNCNWKCLVENFMEGYHLSVVHPETLRGYTPTELCTKGPNGPAFTSYHANYPDDIPPRGSGAENLTPQERHRSFLFNIFPTQVASIAANLLVSLSLQPVYVHQVNVRWTMSVYKDDMDEETIAQRIALWTEVNREDREKLEILHRNLCSSRAYSGPLAADNFEGTIRDFSKYLAEATQQPTHTLHQTGTSGNKADSYYQ